MKHRYTRCHDELIAALVEARQAAGLSQRDVSTKLKRANNFAYYVESGERSLSVCEFIDYALAVSADPAQIMRRLTSTVRGK